MSQNDLVSNGSRAGSHSRKDSDNRPQLPRKRRALSRNNSQEARSSNRTEAESDLPGASATPSAPSSPALQKPNSDSDRERVSALAPELANFLHEGRRNAISTAYDLRTLWTASQEPPINKITLSELDLQKLYHCLYLRHDLNFDRDLQFAPRSACTPVGIEKQMAAQQYWVAIEIELALYISYLEDLCINLRSGGLTDARCSLPRPRSLHKVPQRLRGMIQAICRIVKSLIPPAKWVAVNTRLSPTLFTQELEHGQCDIEDLFCWVGSLLLGSCAPSRDVRIASMMETISQGSRDKDSHMLRRGLQDLFDIFETMKLDAANHQLQQLRDFMLSSSVEDERRQILSRVEHGWEVPNWLEDTLPAQPSFATFMTNFISLVTRPGLLLPTALALDHARIHRLQTTFQLLTFRASSYSALSSTLHRLGWTGPAPASSKDYMASLLSAIEQDSTLDPTEQRDALILGIASHAHTLCAKQGLPTPEGLRHTGDALHALTDPASPTGRDILASLSEQLTKLVEQESETVRGLDAVQLAHRYTSSSSSSSPSSFTSGPLASSGSSIQHGVLEDMARKITHIGILHWRIWAPILYLRDS